MATYDVAIIGGGVVGASAAWFLAREGMRVVLLERDRLAAGASGRNSGAVQHPLDPLPGELHRQTMEIYRELSTEDGDFALDDEPAGLLLVSTDEDAVRQETHAIASVAPQLGARFVPPTELRRLEPALAPSLAACRLETGYPVAPSAATLAIAGVAERAGAEIRIGAAARPLIEGTRVAGVELDTGARLACGQVLLAAGPWTAELVPAWRDVRPIRPVWGVVVAVELETPPRHVLEELGIGDRAPMAPTLFSLVTAGGQSGIGSLFVQDEPDPAAVVGPLLERGAGFVPQLANVEVVGVRSCARPAAFDRRPLVGAVPGIADLFVCAGHGPWGISTGPATARMVAQLMSAGRSPELDAMSEISPARFTPAGR